MGINGNMKIHIILRVIGFRQIFLTQVTSTLKSVTKLLFESKNQNGRWIKNLSILLFYNPMFHMNQAFFKLFKTKPFKNLGLPN